MQQLSVKTIINCPSCKAKVRVPSDRGRLQVKCPNCAHQWFYPEAAETIGVPFKCAQDGSAFTVMLQRLTSSEPFKIDRISRGSANLHSSSTGEISEPLATRKADEFSWSGFYCPCCGYIDDKGPVFVKCLSCEQLVCLSRSYRDKQGQLIFVCSPACGKKGLVTRSLKALKGGRAVNVTKTSSPSLPLKENLSALPYHDGKKPS
jgi:DNA-directed RNA polymerase subunit RPC12/RpoP